MSAEKNQDILKPIENLDLAKDPTEDDYNTDYTDTKTLSFQELLNVHHTQVVWGFKFGQDVMANSRARHKSTDTPEQAVKSPENEPGTSTFTENDHKTPHSRKRTISTRTSKRKTQKQGEFVSPQKTRGTPLPLMNWADANEVWLFMVYKEEASMMLRNPRLFEDFKGFMPRMRAILLDWVMEVCEVYNLRRVTYYLCVDYFDRFLSIRPDVPKNQLQLVGVTCLFLASKLEEVYPPRLNEFSYVCDGACSPEEILACELLILNSLGWDLNIMTPSDWLNLYMQIHFKAPEVAKQKLHVDINKQFIFPQYSGYQFVRASQLLDFTSLDPGFLKFSYSTIAAAAMYFMYGKKTALTVSGLTWKQLQPCAEYMAVFYQILRDSSNSKLQLCKQMDERSHAALANIRHNVKNLVKDENHSLQTHVVNIEFFEQSTIIRLEQMGLKVERTYVKKPSKTKESPPAENEEMVLMFDVEKVENDVKALEDSELPLDNSLVGFPSDADLIIPDSKKALLSFDEILDGLVRCNQKNLPALLSTCKELEEGVGGGSQDLD